MLFQLRSPVWPAIITDQDAFPRKQVFVFSPLLAQPTFGAGKRGPVPWGNPELTSSPEQQKQIGQAPRVWTQLLFISPLKEGSAVRTPLALFWLKLEEAFWPPFPATCTRSGSTSPYLWPCCRCQLWHPTHCLPHADHLPKACCSGWCWLQGVTGPLSVGVTGYVNVGLGLPGWPSFTRSRGIQNFLAVSPGAGCQCCGSPIPYL